MRPFAHSATNDVDPLIHVELAQSTLRRMLPISWFHLTALCRWSLAAYFCLDNQLLTYRSGGWGWFFPLTESVGIPATRDHVIGLLFPFYFTTFFSDVTCVECDVWCAQNLRNYFWDQMAKSIRLVASCGYEIVNYEGSFLMTKWWIRSSTIKYFIKWFYLILYCSCSVFAVDGEHQFWAFLLYGFYKTTWHIVISPCKLFKQVSKDVYYNGTRNMI